LFIFIKFLYFIIIYYDISTQCAQLYISKFNSLQNYSMKHTKCRVYSRQLLMMGTEDVRNL